VAGRGVARPALTCRLATEERGDEPPTTKGRTMSVCINYPNGAVTECIDLDDATARIDAEYPNAVYGPWDSDGENDECQPMERMLVWANEEDAGPEGLGDCGANSCCEIAREVDA
jgi:hypothetical protein